MIELLLRQLVTGLALIIILLGTVLLFVALPPRRHE